MSTPTHKKIEIVGTSPTSYADATRNAIRKASESVRNLEWFEVVEMRGRISGADVEQFQVTLKVGFRLE